MRSSLRNGIGACVAIFCIGLSWPIWAQTFRFESFEALEDMEKFIKAFKEIFPQKAAATAARS